MNKSLLSHRSFARIAIVTVLTSSIAFLWIDMSGPHDVVEPKEPGADLRAMHLEASTSSEPVTASECASECAADDPRMTRRETGQDPGATADPTDLVLRIRSLVGEGASTARILVELQRLKAIDTDASRGALVHLFSDSTVRFTHRAKTFYGLLRDIDHPDIGRSAAEWLDRTIAEGATLTSHYDGYMRLLVSHDATLADARLSTIIQTCQTRQVAIAAAEALLSKDRGVDVASYLTLAIHHSDRALRRAIIDGLASWPSSAAADDMNSMVSDRGLPTESRSECIRALTTRGDDRAIESMLQLLREREENELLVGIEGLSGLMSGGRDAARKHLPLARATLADLIRIVPSQSEAVQDRLVDLVKQHPGVLDESLQSLMTDALGVKASQRK
ncbi:MAG: hypothetical protein IPH13_11460 [Planctomycetes bacterium]|nr:hypothetical protein [Planctomycetota bacterium]MCC7172954.1 hypothetical protein [Planctomycetota bacterium]